MRKNAPIQIVFNGKQYPSKRQAALSNYKRLGMTFERVYKLLQEGATCDKELGPRQKISFTDEKGREWESIKEWADAHFYSKAYAAKLLREAGLIE